MHISRTTFKCALTCALASMPYIAKLSMGTKSSLYSLSRAYCSLLKFTVCSAAREKHRQPSWPMYCVYIIMYVCVCTCMTVCVGMCVSMQCALLFLLQPYVPSDPYGRDIYENKSSAGWNRLSDSKLGTTYVYTYVHMYVYAAVYG